jgi:glycine oxidase
MIVVIGAGLIGLGVAYELARRGATVRVLDESEPGRGASWAGAGMLAPYTEAPESPPFAAFCADSLARYPAFVAGLAADGGVDARLRLDGLLEAAYDPAEADRLRKNVAALRARGVPARWLERDEARMLEPALGATLLGASLCEAEGHVDNRRLGRALRAACEALGVRIEAGAGRVAVEANARRVLGVRGPDGFTGADYVVNATGAWAADLEGLPEHARVPVRPVKGQMLALAMPRGLVRRVLWVPGAYLVPRDDGRLLIGATVEEARFDTRVTAKGIRDLLDAALAALPALGDLAVAETWAGLRPGSPDGLPFLGATDVAGYVVATGHYRNGILLTPATAVAIADVVEGRPAPHLAPFSLRRLYERAGPDSVPAALGQEARPSVAK